ncbi:heparinase II/III family protein [Paenibacillus oryzisoli]|uniref:heparinase II/III domain-containing protein n=1 Tax=Paenibacillus oryzisoli TaxID=1850517 RepID=UPI003D28EA34
MIAFHQLREAILAVMHRPTNLAGGELSPDRCRMLLEAPHLASLIKEIKAEAERDRREPVPSLSFAIFQRFSATGNRKEFEKLYFERRGRLLALTLATVLEADNRRYTETLENLVWDICDEYAWALPAHLPDTMEGVVTSQVPIHQTVDLFAAETAHALAEMLYLVGDRLNPWVAYRVREEIEHRVFQPVFERSTSFGWLSWRNNWSAVCGGAVGMAALLLIDDRERLAGMQDRVGRAMDSFLSGYGEDGCCPEGVGYWNYGFGYFVYWAEMLYAYTGGSIDVLQGEKIRKIARFPGIVALSEHACINYSDCDATYQPHTGLFSRLCNRLHLAPPEMTSVPSFHADHCYRWPHQVRNVLWTDPGLLHAAVEEGNFYFPDTSWLISKRQTPQGLIAFSAKGGNNYEPHNHNDLGHFILHVGGETLLADLGGGEYTREYFGEARYRHLHNGSAGHSVPVVNGCEQAEGAAYSAVVKRCETSSDDVLFDLDLTRAYKPETGLQQFTRTFEWGCTVEDASGHLVLTDHFTFGDEVEPSERNVTEHFISYHKPVVHSGKATWTGRKGSVTLAFDAAGFAAEVEEIATKMHSGLPVTVYRLRLHAPQVPSEYRCRFVFTCRLNRR